MRIQTRYLLLAVFAGLIVPLIGSAVWFQSGHAQTSVVFAIPATVPFVIPNPPTQKGDVVTYTGGPVGESDGGTCVTRSNSYAVQRVIIVDNNEEGSLSAPAPETEPARVTNLVNLSPNTAQPPGTRLLSLVELSHCTIGGVSYQKLSGHLDYP